MKLQRTSRDGNVVTGVGRDWLRVGVVVYRQSLLLTSTTVVPGWAPHGWEGLAESDFASVVALRPEVVLFGSGATLRFPHPRLTRLLADAGIGLETMDTPAACRTFNILAAEERRVAAALIVDATDPQYNDRTPIDDTP
jgi:uncharacterized protein